jgi:hypothetical protein
MNKENKIMNKMSLVIKNTNNLLVYFLIKLWKNQNKK